MGNMDIGQSEMRFFEQDNTMGREGEDSESGNNDNNVHFESLPEGSSRKSKAAKKKKYHRHTPQQILELENFFQLCAHPDEKQRLELGRRLALDSRQVKFWFQNRRTQLKTQIERHENVVLKQEYDKLRMENMTMKDVLRNPLCHNCGGAEVSPIAQNLRAENARLRDELTRMCGIAERYIGEPISDIVSPNSNLELSMGRPQLNGGSMNGSISSEYEKAILLQGAMAAMDELLVMAQTDGPLWLKGLDDTKEVLNYDEYVKKLSPFIGIKPPGFITDATRETSSILITSFELVETMMLPTRWQDMFPCLVSKANTVEVLYTGRGGTRDGELHLMSTEFVFPSPLVPLRQEKVLRFCKQHSEDTWAVVDVSLDTIREPSFSASTVKKWRRLPSGFIVQDVADGHSLVTWIEHSEYDENYIHQLYRPLLRSGLAFGALRWLTTLQRDREYAAIFRSSSSENDAGNITQEGKSSILKLMRRISNSLCSGLSASSPRQWEKLHVEGLSSDVCVMSRVSINEPGEPSGVVLSASTSVWMPMPRQLLFDFLRDEKHRGKWDILANGGPMEIIAQLSKTRDGTNCISLLCPPAAHPRESNMVILQESWTDKTGSFVVYAPVDSASMESVMRGGDSDYLALLPSGFAIADALPHSNNATGSASILTLGFQILVSSLPTAKLTVESIETVNNLMSCTIQKIRDSLAVN